MKKSITFLMLITSIVFGVQYGSASICKSTIKGTETLSKPLSCSDKIIVDGGTLYIDAPLTMSNNLEVKKGGKVIIRKGGSLTIIKGKELIINAGFFLADGHVSIDQNVQVLNGSEFTINAPYHLDVSDEYVVDDSKVYLNGNVTVGKLFEFTGTSKVQVSARFDFKGSSDCVVSGATELTLLYGAEFNALGSGKFVFKGKSSKLTVNPGAYLLLAEADLTEGKVLNNGYIEQTSSSKTLNVKVSIIGDGVLYVLKKSKLRVSRGLKIHDLSSGALSNDFFAIGSDTLRVLRLPKFKIDKSGLVLGDSLRIEDTLNLNGERIDIAIFDFRMPKGQSFNRSGGNSEYIQTTSSGKYKFKMEKNNTVYTAPIGRNPYLPITAECTDCAGVEFAVSVSQNVYQNPETQSNQQTTDAVNETWSIVPQSNISGLVTIQLQWNAGANGTVNSELAGFMRNSCSPVYWIDGQSTNWAEDGTNINVNAAGGDPYTVTITLNGMIGGTTYYFGIKSGASVLPIELASFQAKAQADLVQLEWVTAMEENNDYFSVERSTDGANWEAIGTLAGAGNSVAPIAYSWQDHFPLKGRSYYRIRQFDYDGSNEASDIRYVVFGLETEGKLAINSVYPSPFFNELSIELNGEGNVEMAIINLSGETIRTNQAMLQSNNETLHWNLNDIDSGVYLLRVVSNGQSTCQKVIKN